MRVFGLGLNILFKSVLAWCDTLRRKLPKPQHIWFEAKNFFPCPTLQTCLRIQEMQKFSFYLVRFEIYRQKTKYGPILGLFSKSYNRGLRLIGWTYRIAIFRVDKASEVITFEQKKICKIWPPGGAASILNISVFARFDHVPGRFEGFSQAEMNNLHKIQLTKEKKNKGHRSYGRKSHFSKGHSLFPLFPWKL